MSDVSGISDDNDVRELGRERESGEGSVRRVLGSKRLEANETARNEFFNFPLSQAILTRHFRWGQHLGRQ